MPRKVLKTLNLTNGGKLTYEEDPKTNTAAWYRNGKIINTKEYKFYDKATETRRVLADKVKVKDNGEFVYTPMTLLAMDNYDKLQKDAIRKNTEKLSKATLKYPIGTEKLTLRTKGRMNLATIPKNMLDSIAITSGRSNTDFKTNLGLVGKEDTFGGFSDVLNGGFGNTTEYPIRNLVNNHAYLITPEGEYLEAVNKKLYKGNNFYNDKVRQQIEDDLIYQRKRGGIRNNTKQYSDDYLEDAFLRYADNPEGYNPGQRNYVQMVNNIADEVYNEPQVQRYWNTEGKKYYEKGKQERQKRNRKSLGGDY